METKKTMYEGREVECIDCTPSWSWAVNVYLLAIEQQTKAAPDARKEIMRLAAAYDQLQAKYNDLINRDANAIRTVNLQENKSNYDMGLITVTQYITRREEILKTSK